MGGGLSATSHTTCIGPSNTYSGSGLDKKKREKKKEEVQGGCEGVFVHAHKRARLCVASLCVRCQWDGIQW